MYIKSDPLVVESQTVDTIQQYNKGAMMQSLSKNVQAQGPEPYAHELSLAATGPYHNNLEPFLGPPTKSIDHNPSDQFPHEAWFLPDAYQGNLTCMLWPIGLIAAMCQAATTTSARQSYKQSLTIIRL